MVIVHGASAQIKALAEQQGVNPSNIDGAGITDAETLAGAHRGDGSPMKSSKVSRRTIFGR